MKLDINKFNIGSTFSILDENEIETAIVQGICGNVIFYNFCTNGAIKMINIQSLKKIIKKAPQ